MHILFVWSHWAYPEVAVEFLDKIRGRGHRVTVLLAGCQKETDRMLFGDQVDFHFAPKWDILSRVLSTPYPVFKDVSRYIKMINPDIVHVNSHLFLTSLQAVKAARSLGIPSVVTVHGFMAERGMLLNILQRTYIRLVAKSIFENSSTVICLTDKDAASVAKIAGSYDKISIVPNGVDVELFNSSSEKDSDLITWVGRFVPEKGLVYLVEAMQEIVTHRQNTKLVLVGDGSLKFELMKLTDKLGLSKNVTFFGSAGRTEVAHLLSKSSIFAFPSLREGMPFALLEALASGNAVVASNIDGINVIIEDDWNGVLIPPRNSVELAHSILRLLNDDGLRRKLSENARVAVRERYSWDRVLDQLDNVYEAFAYNAHAYCKVIK